MMHFIQAIYVVVFYTLIYTIVDKTLEYIHASAPINSFAKVEKEYEEEKREIEIAVTLLSNKPKKLTRRCFPISRRELKYLYG